MDRKSLTRPAAPVRFWFKPIGESSSKTKSLSRGQQCAPRGFAGEDGEEATDARNPLAQAAVAIVSVALMAGMALFRACGGEG